MLLVKLDMTLVRNSLTNIDCDFFIINCIGGKMLDEVIKKVVALGVPGLVLVVVMGTTGYAGAAAITLALATLGGPFGMLGGLFVLSVLTLIANAVAQYGIDIVARRVIDGLREKGLSNDQIWKQIRNIPSIILSKRYKRKCKAYIYEDR